MPTYQYYCTECGHELEAVQKFSDDSLTVCPDCAGLLRKRFSAVGVVFKGSGFYSTDNRAHNGNRSQGDGADGNRNGDKSNGSDKSDGSGSANQTSESATSDKSGSSNGEKSEAGSAKSGSNGSGGDKAPASAGANGATA